MVEEFIAEYAKLISKFPDEIEVVHLQKDDPSQITVYANNDDVGRLIGKEGKMIGAIQTTISGCKAKDNISYRIKIVAR